jgi:hypothetical protein
VRVSLLRTRLRHETFAACGRDEDDLRTHVKILGLTTVSAALDLCVRFFPNEPLPPRSRAMLEDLFNEHE